MSKFEGKNREAFTTIACFFKNKANQVRKSLHTLETSSHDQDMYENTIDCLTDLYDYCLSLDQTHIDSFLAKSQLSQEVALLYLYDEYLILCNDDDSCKDRRLNTLQVYMNDKLDVLDHITDKLGRD